MKKIFRVDTIPGNHLVYNAATDTIRQMPQNYLIAYREHGRWICDTDGAADQGLAVQVFLRLYKYDYQYGTPENLINGIQ